MFIFPILSIILANLLCSLSKKRSSLGFVPAPQLIRRMRDSVSGVKQSSSCFVMESIIHKNFLILSVDSFSWPLGIIFALKPGIIPTTWFNGPIFITEANQSRISRNVNQPFLIQSIMCFYQLCDIASLTVLSKPVMSPRPNRRFTNELASNVSRSSKCSPVPRNTIGDSVAATAESDPPPFACPSSLVMMTEPTLTDSLKALA